MVHQPPNSVRHCDASVTSVTAKAPEKLSHRALFYELFSAPKSGADASNEPSRIRLADAIQGHAGHSVASTYRHFDLETLAKGVASIPVPGEKSSQGIHDKVLPDPRN
jgi:hypothetical protein